jgi:hypothetical protein
MDKNLVNELTTALNKAMIGGKTYDDPVMKAQAAEFHNKIATAYIDTDGNLPYNGFNLLDCISGLAAEGDPVATTFVEALGDPDDDTARFVLLLLKIVLQECTRVWMVALDIKDVTHKVH